EKIADKVPTGAVTSLLHKPGLGHGLPLGGETVHSEEYYETGAGSSDSQLAVEKIADKVPTGAVTSLLHKPGLGHGLPLGGETVYSEEYYETGAGSSDSQLAVEKIADKVPTGAVTSLLHKPGLGHGLPLGGETVYSEEYYETGAGSSDSQLAVEKIADKVPTGAVTSLLHKPGLGHGLPLGGETVYSEEYYETGAGSSDSQLAVEKIADKVPTGAVTSLLHKPGLGHGLPLGGDTVYSEEYYETGAGSSDSQLAVEKIPDKVPTGAVTSLLHKPGLGHGLPPLGGETVYSEEYYETGAG